jgi:prespore-specific regulator
MATKKAFSKEQFTMVRAIRNDSWTYDNDKVLADAVLKHIRSGSTQLAAFEEVAERLQRTSAACGFRWNSDVRKRCESEIKQAKAQRQNMKVEKIGRRAATNAIPAGRTELFATVSNVEEQEITQSINAKDYLDQIVYLAQIQKIQLASMVKQIRSLNEQLSEKDNEIERLKRQLEEAKVQPSEITVSEDYRTLLQILKRARQIGAIDEVDKEKPVFRVDANGNIEMIG